MSAPVLPDYVWEDDEPEHLGTIHGRVVEGSDAEQLTATLFSLPIGNQEAHGWVVRTARGELVDRYFETTHTEAVHRAADACATWRNAA